MPRISKPPEERRQELIDVASKLFFKNGYDRTSVREILKEVNGAPGMFYYYFKSKDDIYHEVMKQHIDKYIVTLKNIYSKKEIPIPTRLKMIVEKISETFMMSLGAINKTDSPDNQGFIITMKQFILNSNVEPVTILLNEAFETGAIKKSEIGIDDTKSLALFIIYGVYGLLNDSDITKVSFETARQRISQIPIFLSKILGTKLDNIEK